MLFLGEVVKLVAVHMRGYQRLRGFESIWAATLGYIIETMHRYFRWYHHWLHALCD